MKYAFNYGRMTPPTIGHEKVVAQMSKENDEVFLFLSPSYDSKKNSKNLIPFDGKVDLARDAFRDYNNVEVMTSKGNIIDACKAMELIATDEDEVYLYVGADRFDSIEKMIDRCNGKDFDIANISVKKVERNDDDVSATKVRDAIFHNDFNYFKKNTNYSDPEEFFSMIQAYLGTAEMAECKNYNCDNLQNCDFTCEALYGFDGVNSFIEKLTNILKDRNIRVQLSSDCEELNQQLEDLTLARDALLFEGYDELYNKFCKELNLVDFLFKLDIDSYDEFYFINENELISLIIKYCNRSNNLDEYLYDYDFISWVCIIINDILYVRYIMNQMPAYIESQEGISNYGKVAYVNPNCNDTLLDNNGNEVQADYEYRNDFDNDLEEGGRKNELNPEKTGDALEKNDPQKIADKFIDAMTNELGIPNVDLGNTNPKSDMDNGGFFRKVDASTDKKTQLCVKKGSKAFDKLSHAADNSTKVTEAVQVTKTSDMFSINLNDPEYNFPTLKIKISDASGNQPAGLKLNSWTPFQETVSAAILSLQLDGKISTYDDIFCTLTNSEYRGKIPGENEGINCFKDFIKLLDINDIFKSNNDKDIAEFFKSNEKVGYNKNKQDFTVKTGWGRNWCSLANFRNKISSVLPNMKPKYIAIASKLNNSKEFEIDGIFDGIRMNNQKDFWDKSDIYFVSDDEIAKDTFKDYISSQSKKVFDNNVKAKLEAKLKANPDMNLEELRKIAQAEEIRRIKEIGLNNFNNGNFFGISLKQIFAEYSLETFNATNDDNTDLPKVTSDCFDEPYIEIENKPHFKLDKNGNKIQEIIDGQPVFKANGQPKYEIATSSVFNILINNKFKDLGVLKADKLCMTIRSFNSAGTFGIDFKAGVDNGPDKDGNTKINYGPTLGKGVNNFNTVYGDKGYSFKSFGFSIKAIEDSVEENEEKVPECLANFAKFIKEQGPELFCSFVCSALNLRREGSTMSSAMPYVLLH